MARIFISYRRKDAAADAGRVYDRLSRHFGEQNVTFDVDSIPPGIDFRNYIRDKLDSCDCLLVVIGDRWLELLSHDAQDAAVTDWARFEIECALQRDIPVVPVLVGRATLASTDQLPASIADLSYRNAIEVRSDGSFDGQMARLIEGIERSVPKTTTATTTTARPWKKRLIVAVVLVSGIAVIWQWKSIRREVFGIGTIPTAASLDAERATDTAARDVATAIDGAGDQRPQQPRSLSVRTRPDDQVTAPGQVARVIIAVRGADNEPLRNARVTVTASGRLLNSADERFDPEARLEGPNSVSGTTTSQGMYTAYWVCNPCARAYRLMINVASNGYTDYSGNVTIRIEDDRP